MSANEDDATEGGMVTSIDKFTPHASPQEFEQVFAQIHRASLAGVHRLGDCGRWYLSVAYDDP